jgi:hypothetical protein
LKCPGAFCNVFLPLPCSSWKLEARERFTFFHPCLSVILRILPSISFRSAQHTSVNSIDEVVLGLSILYLLEQKMIMIIVLTEISALREMKGLNFDSRRTETIQPLPKTVEQDHKQRE